jgi:hypothetical protein
MGLLKFSSWLQGDLVRAFANNESKIACGKFYRIYCCIVLIADHMDCIVVMLSLLLSRIGSTFALICTENVRAVLGTLTFNAFSFQYKRLFMRSGKVVAL